MKRVLALIALVLFPVWLLSVTLVPYTINYFQNAQDVVIGPIVLGLLVSVGYFVMAGIWWLNPTGTSRVIRVSVVVLQVIALLAILAAGLACTGC